MKKTIKHTKGRVSVVKIILNPISDSIRMSVFKDEEYWGMSCWLKTYEMHLKRWGLLKEI
ncbi:hypothetical protein CL658_05500 [bacterium]|nr:hypothetical protein [bacterium]|tara:strand:+ start:438 stop:617 length:180 start_codon:yes stop_codon:yes gene_type:complete